MGRKSIALTAALTIVVAVGWAASRSLFPGVPLAALLHPTRTGETWREIREVQRTMAGQHGYLAAFLPDQNTFSGTDGNILYLGRNRSLAAKLVVTSGERLPSFKARAFLDFRPVELTVRGPGAAESTKRHVLEGDIDGNRESVWELRLDDVPEGVSELALVIDSGNGLRHRYDADSPHPLLNRHILVYEMHRGDGGPPSVSMTAPIVRQTQECERSEKVFLMRGDQVAVINCTGEPTRGVLFGSELSPLFYEAPPGTLFLFTTGSTNELFHVGAPYSERSDGEGRTLVEDSLGS
jgi:hypothetical protein